MYQVVKRDGKIVDFEISKISKAITKAFEALGKQYHPSVIDMLALRVTAEYEPLIQDGKIAVESIQDCVEKVLSEAGYWLTTTCASMTGVSRKTPPSPIRWAD